MSKSVILNTGSVGINDALTRYISVAGNLVTGESAELNVQLPIRDAGTANNLFVYVSTNTISVASSVITLRKNAVNTALTVSYGVDETGLKEDTTNSVTLAATDEISYRVVTPTEAGTNTITITVTGFEFTPDTSGNCIMLFGITGNIGLATASQTVYKCPNGSLSGTGTIGEAQAKYRIRSTFTSSNFYTYVSTNTRTTDTVFRTRKNGADGNQVLTYGNIETGVKEDITNTDSLVSGDDYNYVIVTGTGTGSITPRIISSRLLNTSGQFILLAGKADTQTIAFNTTRWFGVAGGLTIQATEAFAQIYPRFTFTAKEFGVYVSANSITTSPTVFTVRDNTADSSIAVSFAAAETGLKLDSTNTAEITLVTDEIDYQVVTPNTANTISFTWIGIMGETAVAAAFPPPFKRRETTLIRL